MSSSAKPSTPVSGVRSSCETVATSSDLSRAASRSAVISRITMMRPISSPAESRTGPGVALEGAADVGELEVVLRRAVGIGRDRLHRGEVGRRVGEAVGDRRALLQRGVLGESEDLGREVLDHGVREQRPALEVDEADAVDACVEQRAVDVDEALERDLVRLHRDLMGLHRDLMRLEAVGLELERGVLALQARVAPGLRFVHGDVVGRELAGCVGHAAQRPHDGAGEVDREDEDQERGADDPGDARARRPAARGVCLRPLVSRRPLSPVATSVPNSRTDARRRGACPRRRRRCDARGGRVARVQSRRAASSSRGCRTGRPRRWCAASGRALRVCQPRARERRRLRREAVDVARPGPEEWLLVGDHDSRASSSRGSAPGSASRSRRR